MKTALHQLEILCPSFHLPETPDSIYAWTLEKAHPMKTLVPIFIFAITSSILHADKKHDCPSCNDAKAMAEIAAHQKIFANAKDLMIYEGLPHPYEEEKLFKTETKRKDTIKFQPLDEAFYSPSTKATNTEPIIKLLSEPGGIKINHPKKCGFHSDYCLEFTSGGIKYRAFTCFGCWEMFVFKGDEQKGHVFWFDKKELSKLLAIYDKKRPKPVKEEKAE